MFYSMKIKCIGPTVFAVELYAEAYKRYSTYVEALTPVFKGEHNELFCW